MTQHIEDLVAPYALDALTSEERERVEEHVRTCSSCLEELRQTVDVVESLPLTLAPVHPSPALRARVLQAIREEAGAPTAGQALPLESASGGVTKLERPRSQVSRAGTHLRAPSRLAPRLLAAAAVLALVIGVEAGRLSTERALSPQQRYQQLVGSSLDGGDVVVRMAPSTQGFRGHMALAVTRSGRGFLLVGPSPSPPRGDVYQLWMLNTLARARSGRVFTADSSTARKLPLTVRPIGYKLSAITVEPGPRGSPKPTSRPITLASLGHG